LVCEATDTVVELKKLDFREDAPILGGADIRVVEKCWWS
jgi:hypothetical protein